MNLGFPRPDQAYYQYIFGIDDFAVAAAITVELSDSFLLSDDLQTEFLSSLLERSVSDSFTFTDTISAILLPVFFIELSDNLNLSESLSATLALQLNVTLTDSNNPYADAISASLVVATQQTITLDDSFTLSDDFTTDQLQQLLYQLTDQLILNDFLLVQYPNENVLSEQITLSDEISISLGVTGLLLSITLADSLNLSDELTQYESQGVDDYYRRYLDDRVLVD